MIFFLFVFAFFCPPLGIPLLFWFASASAASGFIAQTEATKPRIGPDGHYRSGY